MSSSSNPSLEVAQEDDEVPKLVHQFYFVKLWPSSEPDSISQIKKQELTVEKMNRDIREITDKIKEKISEKDYVASGMRSSYYWKMEWRRRVARKGKILSNLYVALDELCFMNNAPRRRSKKKKCFKEEELDNHNLNALMRHGSTSLAEEKQILRNMNTHQRDADKFQSLEVLRNTIKWGYYENHCHKLLREIEQFQNQRKKAAANASAKGKIPGYVSMKNAIKDQIKVFCDESSENRKKEMAEYTKIRNAEKKQEVINQELHSLKTKLGEKQKKKGEAYESITKVKQLYDEEVTNYYKYCSLMNKVQHLAEKKDTAALDKLSRYEVDKFMFEWNSNKAFREAYAKKIMQPQQTQKINRDWS
ncbi:proton pump-interactor BIP131 [Arachis duranensis]|uniref:Proton pump-interactor BIP131 n=1 Tax=Arachis duranensis TaxID=130453 RepID=A0A6P5MPK4_ARADU|nr:proton pump-interactor BIP131 [Arachis duranensis]